MRRERMTEDEYNMLKEEVQRLEIEIKPLRQKLISLKKRISWYEYSANTLKDYSTSLCVKMFGKRFRDLSEAERREYKRITTADYRKRIRGNDNDRSEESL